VLPDILVRQLQLLNPGIVDAPHAEETVKTHLVRFYHGATWNLSRKVLFNWRDKQAGDFETLVKTFVSPSRVLRAYLAYR
jgi:hypothetical protein